MFEEVVLAQTTNNFIAQSIDKMKKCEESSIIIIIIQELVQHLMMSEQREIIEA
jgi:hypothetical protein